MDINTIFYFPSSLTFEEYSNQLNQGQISERTIVFADAQKAIYKGGKKYGGTSVQEFHELIDTLYDDSWISDEINNIKGDIIESIARLDQFNTLITNVSSRLNTEIQERDNNIREKVEQLMDDAAWLRENFPQGVTQWDAGWNQDLEAYLQTVGYWTTDSNNQTITQWSKLQQQINSVESSVNSLKVNGNLTQALTTSIQQLITDKIASLQLGTTYATVEKVNNVEKILEWMYSGLESSASGDITFSEMSSMAKNTFMQAISDIRTQVSKVANGDFVAQTEIASKVGNTISTMLAQAANDNALAGMAARLDEADSHISSIILGVTGSNSTADLATRIGNKMGGFLTSADITAAKAEIYSAIGAKDGNDNFISIASLKTQSDADHSSISGIATRVGTLETNQAGFVASANLGSSVAEMFASSGNGQNTTAKANVVALVKDNKSQLQLTASDVNIDGYLNAGSATFKGDVQATSFTTGNSNEVGIGVMSGEFNEQFANPNKAYFAYDSTQGGITMWYYQNNEWKRLDLTSSAVIDSADAFQPINYYTISNTNTSILPSNLTTTTLYYNRVDGKYYSDASRTNPVSGTYYDIPNYTSLFNIETKYKAGSGSSGATSSAWNYGYVGEVSEFTSCVKIDVDGTSSECALLSKSIKSSTVSAITVNSGAVTSTKQLYVRVAVSDVKFNNQTNRYYAVVAPVITVQSNDIWGDSNQFFPSITSSFTVQGGIQTTLEASKNYIAPNGTIYRGIVRSGYPDCSPSGYKRVTIGEALNYTVPSNYAQFLAQNIAAWNETDSPISISAVIYPGEPNYPY